MSAQKNIYFVSDFHLGTPTWEQSHEREQAILRWLKMIQPTCSELFLMGDVFDFWFEYQKVVPKGFVRLLGKLAEMSDAGIKIYFFKGNHDMWLRNYFQQELNITVVSDELEIERNGKKFYLHHGDGLGTGDKGYQWLKKVFRSPICRFLFEWIHPNIGVGLALGWSRKSRMASENKEHFESESKEWLAQYAKELDQQQARDFYIFGHRHLPLQISLNERATYINTGEWLYEQSYAVFDGVQLSLKFFEKEGKAANF